MYNIWYNTNTIEYLLKCSLSEQESFGFKTSQGRVIPNILKIGLKSIGSLNVRLLVILSPFSLPLKKKEGEEKENELRKPVFNMFFLVIHSIFTEDSTMIRLIYIFFFIIFILSTLLVKTNNNWLAFTYFCNLWRTLSFN